ncbi:flagellar filament capping protein FliD [Pseudoalteromonas shioyasakiensis]|uniref:flagellar filament capping protein FliD n=1 Tax=Pseudoalteromonas shioyasakiensis TaxID=1190813 RepID=UPI0021185C36|nr:flagellar filament capping protein FliD [Pseudoalteromonas shioyasakiensis]MCQ8877505.1 flagellar filament capping protein FliD [Pseudoalteromonas shioyasakiensis]
MSLSALGIDPANLASQYTQIERQGKDQALNTKYNAFNAQIEAFTHLKSNLSDFLDDLKNSQAADSSLLSNSATSSNESAMNLTASGDAVSGEYDVFVEQLAQSHQVALSFDPNKALATDGELTIDLAGESFTLDFSALGADPSLKDVANAINSHADNSGVKATVVRSGNDTFLMMTSEESGAANTISLSFTPGADANGAEVTAAIAGQQELSSGQDAIVKLGANSNITVTATSNTLKDVIDGVTITLSQAQQPGDAPVHVSVAQDQQSSKENIQNFVEKFNTLISSIEDSDALKRDSMAGGLARSLKNDFQGLIEGQTLYSVGIEFDRNGNVTIDNERLEAAMSNDPEQLAAMLTGESGLMAKLEERVEPYTKSYGLINDKKGTLQASLDLVVEKQQRHEYSMEMVYNRYLSQFTQMQQTIAQLESSMGQF